MFGFAAVSIIRCMLWHYGKLLLCVHFLDIHFQNRQLVYSQGRVQNRSLFKSPLPVKSLPQHAAQIPSWSAHLIPPVPSLNPSQILPLQKKKIQSSQSLHPNICRRLPFVWAPLDLAQSSSPPLPCRSPSQPRSIIFRMTKKYMTIKSQTPARERGLAQRWPRYSHQPPSHFSPTVLW